MKTVIICFSQRGLNLAEKLKTGLNKSGHRAEISVKSGYIKNRDVHCVTESLNDWTARQFREKDALYFIGACGIAVRAIAPFIKSKDTDPAVIAIDETGNFSVPLTSGRRQRSGRTGGFPHRRCSCDYYGYGYPSGVCSGSVCKKEPSAYHGSWACQRNIRLSAVRDAGRVSQ